MTRRVVFSQRANEQLGELYDYIADANSPTVAQRFTDAVVDFCEAIAEVPFQGRARPDLLPDLRTVGFRRRAVIAFTVSDEVVEILGVYYGGRDYESLLTDAH